MWICFNLCVRMPECATCMGYSQRKSDPQILELQEVVSHLTGVLVTELRSPGRAAGAVSF